MLKLHPKDYVLNILNKFLSEKKELFEKIINFMINTFKKKSFRNKNNFPL